MVNAPETMTQRHISTGRGGAANFKKANNMAKKQNSITPAINSQRADTDIETELALTRIATQASLGARFATGRGGAGNILPSGQAPLPAQTQPLASQPRPIVRTGRGGAGNFRDSKTGRSYSEGASERAQDKDKHRPNWANRVPRIESDIVDSHDAIELQRVQSSTGSVSSRKSSTGAGFFGKMRRRLSSFSATQEP